MKRWWPFSFYDPELQHWHSMPTRLMQAPVTPSCCQLVLVCSLGGFCFCRHINFLICPIEILQRCSTPRPNLSLLNSRMCHQRISMPIPLLSDPFVRCFRCIFFKDCVSFSIFVYDCDQIDHPGPLTVKIALFHPCCQQQPVTREQTVSFPQQYDFNFGRTGCPSYRRADNGQVCFPAECFTVWGGTIVCYLYFWDVFGDTFQDKNFFNGSKKME